MVRERSVFDWALRKPRAKPSYALRTRPGRAAVVVAAAGFDDVRE